MARTYKSKRGIVYLDPTAAADHYLVAMEYMALGEQTPEVRCIHLVSQKQPNVATDNFFAHVEEAGFLIGQECFKGSLNVTWNGGAPKVYSGDIPLKPIKELLEEAQNGV